MDLNVTATYHFYCHKMGFFFVILFIMLGLTSETHVCVKPRLSSYCWMYLGLGFPNLFYIYLFDPNIYGS